MHRHLLLLLLLIPLLFLFTGCNSDPEDITAPPTVSYTNADWQVIWIAGSGDALDKDYAGAFSLLYTGLDYSVLNETDTATIEVDGVEHDFIPLFSPTFGIWISSPLELDLGVTHELSFSYNGNTKASVEIRLPDVPEVTFPTTYLPTQEVELSWTLASNSQWQQAGVDATSPDEENTDEFYQNLAPSARTTTIPANSVTSQGMGTVYELSVSELNYKLSNRIAFSCFGIDAKSYGDSKGKTTIDLAKSLLKRVPNHR